jgi:hypothetical protein
MARGDVTSALQSLAASAVLTIQPAAGVEWVIHDLYFGAACDVKFTNGTDSITIESPTAAGQRNNRAHHATSTRYFTITNTSGGTAVFGYDGVITRE